MKNFFKIIAVISALFILPSAHADSSSGQLAGCMLSQMNQEDRVTMVQWMYGALGAEPNVAGMSDFQFESLSHRYAAIISRLLTIECKSEALATIKNEGRVTLLVALQKVTQEAARFLLTSPNVDQRLKIYARYLDVQKLNALGDEAGGIQNSAPRNKNSRTQ